MRWWAHAPAAARKSLSLAISSAGLAMVIVPSYVTAQHSAASPCAACVYFFSGPTGKIRLRTYLTDTPDGEGATYVILNLDSVSDEQKFIQLANRHIVIQNAVIWDPSLPEHWAIRQARIAGYTHAAAIMRRYPGGHALVRIVPKVWLRERSKYGGPISPQAILAPLPPFVGSSVKLSSFAWITIARPIPEGTPDDLRGNTEVLSRFLRV
jgi:hypothetical protein